MIRFAAPPAAFLLAAAVIPAARAPAEAAQPGARSAETMNEPVTQHQSKRWEQATFGGGCFWCLEAVFERLQGVRSVVSGYAGGQTAYPTYQQVCTGRTGHAEVVQITYDPAVISYDELLEVFFSMHDPTTLNRQGPDVGTQYRSIILYHNAEQRALAERRIRQLNASGALKRPVVTQVEPLKAFYPAEPYHQDYFRRNPHKSYCVLVIQPKVRKLLRTFREQIR